VHAPEILPSILACDLARLGEEVDRLSGAVDTLHFDVMDGRYVDNISFGQPVMRSLRAAWQGDIDVHLMIVDPSRYAAEFVAAGASSVAFHPEVEERPLDLVRQLRALGARVGVGLRPDHPLSDVESLLPEIDILLLMTVHPGFAGQAFLAGVLPKITEAYRFRADAGLDYRIQVDGGVTAATVIDAAAAGADWFVAGTSVFAAADPASAAVELHDRALGAMRTD